ncbi:hypothetical protein ES708_23513 [subsurface metagenome]
MSLPVQVSFPSNHFVIIFPFEGEEDFFEQPGYIQVFPGFNTPEFKVNVSYLQRNFYDNVGFKVVWRWQDSFFWQSPFGDGIIDPIFTFDAQLTYKLENLNSTLKFGVNNFINIQHVNNYGGPKMGALYFMSITFNDLFRKKQEQVGSRQ